MRSFSIMSNKNVEIKGSIYEPNSEACGIIQIAHGMVEDRKRYIDFIDYLLNKNYIVVIHDHIGHGESVKCKEDLGYFYNATVDDVVEDLYKVTKYIKSIYNDLKITLIGYSMGSLIARCYLKEHDDEISKIVLIGPPTENKYVEFGINLIKKYEHLKGCKYRSKKMHNIILGNFNRKYKVENEWLCSDPEVIKQYNQSKEYDFIFTLDGFNVLLHLMKQSFNIKSYKIKNKELPILLLAGKDDPIIQSKEKFLQLKNFFVNIGYTNIHHKLYDNMRHELLHEINKEIVREDIDNFIKNK